MSDHIKEEHLTSSELAPDRDPSRSLPSMGRLQSITDEEKRSKEANATANENLEFVLVKEECHEKDDEISIKPEPMLVVGVQQEHCEEDGAREMLMDVDPLTASFMARDSDEDSPSSTSPTSSQAFLPPGASTSSDRHQSRATPSKRHFLMTPSDQNSRMTPSDGSRMTLSDRHSRITPADPHSRRTPTPTSTKGKKRKAADALDEALILVVNEMKSLRQEQQPDSVDAFCRFMASSLRKVSTEQRDICQALCYNALRRGKRGGLSEEHKIVKVEALDQSRMM